MALRVNSRVLTLICIAGRLEAISEGTALEMSEISRNLASLIGGQLKISDGLEELRVMSQISGLMAWKTLQWTRSTASDGDIRSSNESFRGVLMEKYFPGVERADIVCMVVGKCVIA